MDYARHWECFSMTDNVDVFRCQTVETFQYNRQYDIVCMTGRTMGIFQYDSQWGRFTMTDNGDALV